MQKKKLNMVRLEVHFVFVQSCCLMKLNLFVQGTLLSRKLTRLPKRRCWFVGYSEEDSLDIALKFNDTWETDWRMGIHDCRNYANGLVECLTGEKLVLERLRRRTAWLI